MSETGEQVVCAGREQAELTPLREVLRTATREPHERLHLHPGFSRTKDGTISLPDYRALLVRLYGFYTGFEATVGADPIRTQWLEADLAWSGVAAARLPGIARCTDIPQYLCAQSRLGALYVVEGSALGGRQLYRGLDRLVDQPSIDGRRFFAGRSADTGAAWLAYLDRLAQVAPDPAARAAVVGAAIATFGVFEQWLSGWDKTA